MAVDADKIDHGVTKGKAVIMLHTWEDHLWAIGSKGEPPEAVSVSASAPGVEGTDAVDDKDAGGGEGGNEHVGDHTAEVTDGPVSGTEEQLTPEGNVPVLTVIFSNAAYGPTRGIRSSTSRALASSTNDSRRPPAFCFPDAHDDSVHSAHSPRTTFHADSHHSR
jgi:translation initiation factor 2D